MYDPLTQAELDHPPDVISVPRSATFLRARGNGCRAAQGERPSVVASAKVFAGARRKALTKRTPDGDPGGPTPVPSLAKSLGCKIVQANSGAGRWAVVNLHVQ